MSKESRNVPQRIYEMEDILDQAIQKMDELEEKMAEYEAFQPEIRKLEAYYTSPQWKEDFAADEAGEYPESLKRGVLSMASGMCWSGIRNCGRGSGES